MNHLPGGMFGRYEVVDRLTSGGMGDLYLARDPAIDRPVVIKLLQDRFDTEEARVRFIQEGQAAGRLRHKNIVTIFDVGELDGRSWIAMEYIGGETFAQKIARRAVIPIVTKLRYMEDVCAGLEYAHRRDIVHRDVKPANIMVDDEDLVKILDFGIAHVGDRGGISDVGVLVGTPSYMAPEQAQGAAIDSRTDVFAVGAVFYELLTYERAFPGDATASIHRAACDEPTPIAEFVPDVDPKLVRIIERALAKDPAQRYSNLKSMAADIASVRYRLEPPPPMTTIVFPAESGAGAAAAPRPLPVTPPLSHTPRPATSRRPAAALDVTLAAPAARATPPASARRAEPEPPPRPASDRARLQQGRARNSWRYSAIGGVALVLTLGAASLRYRSSQAPVVGQRSAQPDLTPPPASSQTTATITASSGSPTQDVVPGSASPSPAPLPTPATPLSPRPAAGALSHPAPAPEPSAPATVPSATTRKPAERNSPVQPRDQMPNTPAPAVPQAAAVPTPASSPTETNTGLVLSPPGRTEAAPSPADNPSPRVEAPPAAAVAPAEIPSAPARSTIAPPPAAAAAAPAPAMNDEDAIQQLLNEYRSAYEALDIDRVLRVYPALQNPDALRSAFRDAKEVLIGFTRPVIRITSPAAAIVTCKRTQTFVPKIGGGGRAATTNTTFALRKEGTRWVIVNIS